MRTGSWPSHPRPGLRGLLRQMRDEAPLWARTLPQVPRLVHRLLSEDAPGRIESAIDRLQATQRRQSMVLAIIAVALVALLAGTFFR